LISDPSIPYCIALYFQLIINIIVVSFILYLIYLFVSTIRTDIDNKIEIYSAAVLQQINSCSREYNQNNCAPPTRVPALEKSCLTWEKCMQRDPAQLGKARIGAETFAEIINGFVKPISWKAIFFVLLITVGSLYVNNVAFGTYKGSY
ncbi:hypothetical protein PACTADRAFT_21050, partial [Pachysolen tannophilus NRRL Y-2460]